MKTLSGFGTVLFALLLCCTMMYSQETSDNNSEGIIRTGNFLNTEEGLVQLIRSAENMPLEVKESLYRKYEKNPWLFSGLNVLVPGLGSWFMGDTTGALIAEGGTLAVIVLAISAGAAGSFHASLGALIVGASGMAVVEIAGVIIPFVYAGNYNNRLRLGLGWKVTFSDSALDSSRYAYQWKKNRFSSGLDLEIMEFRF